MESASYQCIDCKQVKPEEQFYRTPINKRGRVSACIPCYRKRMESRWTGKFSSWAEKSRDNHLKRKYGINTAQYQKMKSDQGGKCAICGTTDPGRQGEFHVDHCHSGGGVRGLLCMKCNQALGLLKDSVELLESAAAYLREHRKDEAA